MYLIIQLQSEIEALNFGILTSIDPEASRDFVKGVMSLPNLKTLMIDGIENLDDTCFSSFAMLSSTCQVNWFNYVSNNDLMAILLFV